MSDNELYQQIGMIGGKLDSLITLLEKHIDDDDKVETRVRQLEGAWGKVLGISLAVSAVISLLGSKVLALITVTPKP